MKKQIYAILSLGLLLGSCSSEEPTGGKGNQIEAQVTNYLTVNIVPTTGTGTRADGDNVQNGETYRDGTESEQQVNSIRFFFFDEKGNGAPVSVLTTAEETSTNVSYIDWTHYDSNRGPGIPGETVESTLTATLGLSIPDGGSTPTSLIAVINPSDAVINLTGTGTYGPKMSEVQNLVADYETGLTNRNFVMSNSVYANTNVSPANTVNYTNLVVGAGETPYFQSSIEAAQANPVRVYVERVAARLDLKIGIENPTSEGYYPVMKKVDGGEDIQVKIDLDGDGVEEPIYVNFLGWNVTTTPDKSNLVKNINPAWTSNQLFGASNWIWNSMDFHRSFWAINPENFNYKYGNFGLEDDKDEPGNYQPAQANKMPEAGQFATTYMLENASPATGASLAPAHPTQVILAAQLVTADGKAVELAEWGYKKYTQTDLLNYLVTNIISKGNYWKQTGDNSYARLQPSDLTFISAAQKFPGETLPENVESYYSYIVLKTTDPATKWFQWNGEGDEPTTETLTPVSNSVIDQDILNSVGYTMMWNSGYTYYYFDVRHLGQVGSPAFYGIVRNHIYESTVTSLYGFGTPVCNPEEIIIPEAPKYEEVLLAAEIRILQWRVVSNDYELDWR